MSWQQALVQATERVAEAYEYQAYHVHVTEPIVIMGGLAVLVLATAAVLMAIAHCIAK